jgi:GAF domain-containing protein
MSDGTGNDNANETGFTRPLFEYDDSSTLRVKYQALERLMGLIVRDCSFGELVSEVLRTAIESVKSEAGSFLELDKQNNCLFFRAVTGRSSQALLSVTVPSGQGVVGFVCENKEPMALSRIDENSIYLHSISASVGFEARNVLAVPVVIRGATFGCIELLNRLGQDRYSAEDKDVLVAIAEQAARVIENRLVNAALSKQAFGHGDKDAA